MNISTFHIAIVVALLPCLTGYADSNITGVVKSTMNQPIKGVLVRAWRGPTEVARETTDDSGQYMLSVKGAHPIDALMFTHGRSKGKVFPGRAVQLSGTEDHMIHVILFEVKDLELLAEEGNDDDALLEQVTNLQQFFLRIQPDDKLNADKHSEDLVYLQSVAKDLNSVITILKNREKKTRKTAIIIGRISFLQRFFER
tara:strand:+ start:103 stop:699 length:597 start_codon:yes stop_codon:yes gene_type:complete